MTWAVFAGEHSKVFSALLLWRCHKDKHEATEGAWGAYLKAHIQRGLGYLAAEKRVRNITSLLAINAIEHG